MATNSRVRISPLGGVGEVGKNSTIVEFGEDMVIVDAGVKFPEAELHGVDLVVCDYGYVGEHLDSLLGILFTHGHEDHIGGVPYLLMPLDPHDPIPIYGTALTLGLISVKLKEHGMLGRVIQHTLREGEHAVLGPEQPPPHLMPWWPRPDDGHDITAAVTRLATRSIVSPPNPTVGGSSAGTTRRARARIRASSSSMPNGLVR